MKIGILSLSTLVVVLGLYAYRDDTKNNKFIEPDYMDSTVKPGDNFFSFVNGQWIKNAVIPPTETRIGSFLDLYNRTKKNLKSILDSVSSFSQAPGSLEQKVGDFYASGMDTVAIEKRGYDPVKPYLQQINALTDVKSLLQFEAQSHKEGFSYLVGMGIGADDKNSSLNIAAFYQTGLGSTRPGLLF